MASSTNNPFNPRPHPPPTPVPPPPSPHPHPRIIVIVLISLACIFVLGSCMFCIWWIIKRRKEKKYVHERKDVNMDEHVKVHETIEPGHHGKKKVMVSVDDDRRVHKDVHREEIDKVGKGLHGEP